MADFNDEELEKVLQATREIQAEQRRKSTPKPKPREGVCSLCGGVVTETFHHEATAPVEMIPIGPGSRNYFRWKSSGLYCKDCGVMFHHLPKPKPDPKPDSDPDPE
jgi:hypothetical protein